MKMKKEAIYANVTKKKGNSESSVSLKMCICARISMSAILSRVPVLRQVFNVLYVTCLTASTKCYTSLDKLISEFPLLEQARWL